jgi:hypothetical protein
MSLVLQSSSGGQITIQEPATASNFTQTLPAATGEVVVTGANSAIVSGTAVASTSGTSIDFTGIPSWVRRITIMLNGVSTNGTVPLLFQIGNGSIVTTGYVSSGTFQGAAQGGTTSTAGFLNQNGGAVADTICGITTLVSFGNNTWVSSSVSATGSSNFTYIGAGAKTLSGTLDRLRITTTNGTDTFDAGSINILYE